MVESSSSLLTGAACAPLMAVCIRSLLTRAACAPLMADCIRKLQTTNATLPSSEELMVRGIRPLLPYDPTQLPCRRAGGGLSAHTLWRLTAGRHEQSGSGNELAQLGWLAG